MRYVFSSFVFLAAGLLAMPAMADPGDKEAKQGDGGPRPEMREKMLKEFDQDGDGKLSDEEREKAHEKMRELHGDRGGRGERGKGRRGEGARGGPDGPPKLPKPEELFAKFDKDTPHSRATQNLDFGSAGDSRLRQTDQNCNARRDDSDRSLHDVLQ